jgi:hypothetical protein
MFFSWHISRTLRPPSTSRSARIFSSVVCLLPFIRLVLSFGPDSHPFWISSARSDQWGACWLTCQLYEKLGLDGFWAERLPPSRKGTRWDLILQTLVLHRLIAPGSEWRLHRDWFEKSAMADLSHSTRGRTGVAITEIKTGVAATTPTQNQTRCHPDQLNSCSADL